MTLLAVRRTDRRWPRFCYAMRTWILVAAALACTGVVDAQTRPGAAGRIVGRVVEARTGTPLAAVLLQIANTRQRTLTDEEGRFTIEDVPAGPQTLVVSVVGFGLVRHDLVVAPGQTTELTIPVVEGASAYVEDVVVAAESSRPPAQAGASQSGLSSGELLALGSVMAH